jgi:hypothetical protein
MQGCREGVSLTPVANFPPESLTPVANLPPVALTPGANLPPVSLSLKRRVRAALPKPTSLKNILYSITKYWAPVYSSFPPHFSPASVVVFSFLQLSKYIYSGIHTQCYDRKSIHEQDTWLQPCRLYNVHYIVYLYHTAKTKCRKFETNIPRKGISGPQSQFPHSVCERIIYSHDGSASSAGGNMQTDPGNI